MEDNRNLKPYLVDVPVKVNVWIRPECQKKQFEVLRQARPSILFVQSDGGRDEKEWAAIRENRRLFDEQIDWVCTVYRLYEEENLGLYTMGTKVKNFIWDHVDRCVFLEDDHIPSVSFFRYCAELLEKYKDDLRIDRICGMNHLEKCEDVTSDYFFSRHGSIWGTATWKRCNEMRDEGFLYGKDPYTMRLLKDFTKENKAFLRGAVEYSKKPYYEGHVAGSEFFHGFATYGYYQLQIVPRVNLISNIGCDTDSAHADSLKYMPRGTRRMFNMKTHELEFPLKHPKYMIPDEVYEKKVNRIGAYNYPLVLWYRKIEHAWLLLINGKLTQRLAKKLKNKKRHET